MLRFPHHHFALFLLVIVGLSDICHAHQQDDQHGLSSSTWISNLQSKMLGVPVAKDDDETLEEKLKMPNTSSFLSDNENKKSKVRKHRPSLVDESSLPVKMESFLIDKQGDVTLTFADFAQQTTYNIGDSIKLDARIGIFSECKKNEIVNIVDISTICSTSSAPYLVIHGGWFRRAIRLHNIKCNWEPVLVDTFISDPDSKYSLIGRLENPIRLSLDEKDNENHRRFSTPLQAQKEFFNRRKLLEAPPSQEELDIDNDMMQGRMPAEIIKSHQHLRLLSSSSIKTLLVHGYCSNQNPFPLEDFDNAIGFKDPDDPSPKPASWTNDVFARKIAKFVYEEGIHSCSIIGHSQGGLAALHLYTYYWSCLDNGVSSRRILQSVGSPYLGSPLADLIFPHFFPCAPQENLTPEGAAKWLKGIPAWARDKVYYYTTSGRSEPTEETAPPCNVISNDIFDNLNLGINDGVVAVEQGQLEGGHNMGNSIKECHVNSTILFSYPGNCLNKTRNLEMSTYAQGQEVVIDPQMAIENACTGTNKTWPTCASILSEHLQPQNNATPVNKTSCDTGCSFIDALECAGKVAECIKPCVDPLQPSCTTCFKEHISNNTCFQCLKHALGQINEENVANFCDKHLDLTFGGDILTGGSGGGKLIFFTSKSISRILFVLIW